MAMQVTGEWGSLLDQLVRVRPRQHSDYSEAIRSGKLDPVWPILSSGHRLPKRTMETIATRTEMPINTLKTWRKKLRTDSEWRPDPHRCGVHLTLGLEIEDLIVDDLHELLRQRMYLPRKVVIAKAKAKVNELIDGGALTAKREWKCSDNWFRGFLKRGKFSFRMFHTFRRAHPDDDIVQSFLNEYEVARMQFPESLIVNMDETSWRISNNSMETLALSGADDVQVLFDPSEKQCLTAIAAISRDGSKLPLWVICRGKTDRCEQRFLADRKIQQHIRNDRLKFTFSPSGWTTTDVAKDYLKWLRERNRNRYSYLLWDVFSAHRSQDVTGYALEQKIHLAFVPAGLTSVWQPLDRKVFGSLKQRARERFDNLAVVAALRGQEFHLDWVDAINILVETWMSISDEEILSSWKTLED